MTKEEKHAIRKEYKDWFARRTTCREQECPGYRRFCFTTRLFTFFIKNNPYYENMYDIIVYNKVQKDIVYRYDRYALVDAMKLVAIWATDNMTAAYNSEQKID